MSGREPNKEDAPYRPVKPGGKPWPGYPKPPPPGWTPKQAKRRQKREPVNEVNIA